MSIIYQSLYANTNRSLFLYKYAYGLTSSFILSVDDFDGNRNIRAFDCVDHLSIDLGNSNLYRLDLMLPRVAI